MSLRSTVGTIAKIVWRMSVNGLHLILPGRQRNIGRLGSMVKWSGEVSFLAAKFEGADAYSYMDFCCDSYVTPVVAAICRGFHGVIEGRGGLQLSMDFVGMAM